MNQTPHSQSRQTNESVLTHQFESSAAQQRSVLSGNNLLRLAIVAAGIALVAASLFQNWFDIPAARSLALSFDDIVRQTPDCQVWFQAIVAIGTLLLLLITVFMKQRLICTLLACTLLFVSLTFPYFVMLRSPVLAADASWLQMQHDNLTWLGGELKSIGWIHQGRCRSRRFRIGPFLKLG